MLTHRRRAVALLLSPLLLIALIAIPLLIRQMGDDNATSSDASLSAIDWLRTQQQPDGGYAGFSGDSDPGMTADVLLAFAAAGVDPSTVTSSDRRTPVDFLAGDAMEVASDPGLAAKAALALQAAGANARDAGGVDLIDAIEAGFNAATGWYGSSLYGHALAVLALHAHEQPVPSAAVDALLRAQAPDGAWGFAGAPEEGSGDSNTTSIVIQALAAIGQGDDAIQRGLDYLRSLQDDNGAIAYDGAAGPDIEGDANSTALAIQAFVAAGEDPSVLPNGSLLKALTTFQNESGAFQYQPSFPDDSLLATAQAVPALLSVALPYERVTALAPESTR